ncbi:sulfate/thiosulfate transporter subunit, membrane component of ABC superfamily [Magnetospirillum gryphiswaldense MSR-1 v2]|uniref:Sulfate transport system permease protein CysT n=1 Tax=Magnetospirillum gryphiswaldense (strain DSM 6361 / JCM 21280 / NBRC 15271 / MSR-1) TaxID=431944 RepID=V6F2G4_MAGGM|nr:sulfate ABC transporter permease subunit CysT [Magnetospirillum gryphiswaldense]CDK98476.1 sulfate/thiosulfate transporter subunit, membrane component of ABC superfamily [Magnetospirillum gryphiswaldense MSR-1 v2]
MTAKTVRVIPGFSLTLGLTIGYLSLVVLIPLAALILKAAGMTAQQWLGTLTDARVLASFRLSFGGAAIAALVNGIFGLLVAWVLVRYPFPGRKVIDAFIDLPFALPTAVAGIALTALYAPNGWIGSLLPFKVAFTPLGAIIAMIFIGVPFVVRTVEPVLQDVDAELEEAAACLGASRVQTFVRVILPSIAPALLTGISLAFARAVGEYGSIIFIAGNLPGVSEIAPLLIVTKLEQYDYVGATAIASLMLAVSFAMLLAINMLQKWNRQRLGGLS